MASDKSSSTLADLHAASNDMLPEEKSQVDPTGPFAGGKEQNDSEKAFKPVKARAERTEGTGSGQTPPSRSYSLHTTRSYGDGYGYTSFGDGEEPRVADGEQDGDPEKQFEVQWDGDNDPMNPRSRSKPRKWLVVLLVSTSSLCVYVNTCLLHVNTEIAKDLYIFSLHIDI